jgi:hypothetical protein
MRICDAWGASISINKNLSITAGGIGVTSLAVASQMTCEASNAISRNSSLKLRYVSGSNNVCRGSKG